MNKDFSRIITLLRKEKRLSQKQVAADLEISQALLSHYEKGIRECGLDFVVKTADYYQVSCDYLLGRTPQRNGATLKIEDIPESLHNNSQYSNGNILISNLNKKLIINTTTILFELLDSINNKGLTANISNYLMVSAYKMFRIIYSANQSNPDGMFAINPQLYSGFLSAQQSICEASALALSKGNPVDRYDGISADSAPQLSPEKIAELFPIHASSLLNLIQATEILIK